MSIEIAPDPKTQNEMYEEDLKDSILGNLNKEEEPEEPAEDGDDDGGYIEETEDE